MRVVATAPGKLVLLGEYAVLEGSPALALAVDRRATVTLTPPVDDDWEVVSPTLGVRGRVEGPDAVPELAWVATVLETLPFRPPPARMVLDTGPFHLHRDPSSARPPAKLGLGSSAALTVALVGALHVWSGQPAPTLDGSIRVHRALQHGRGSGVDVAASWGGGLSCYRTAGGIATRRPATLPEGVRWCCVYSGRPASTTALLASVDAWRDRDPDAYSAHLADLDTIASRGVDAVTSHDAAALLSSLRDYAQALARLGEASETDIASDEHRALGTLAAECGAVYKSCGAGGGDVGVALATDGGRLHEFATRAGRAGFAPVETGLDRQGLVTNVACDDLKEQG